MKKLIATILSLCLLAGFALLGVACNKTDTPVYEEEYKVEGGTKAIVILPGLLAGGLYDQETGEALWDPLRGDDVDILEFMGVYDDSHENVTIDTVCANSSKMLQVLADLFDDNDASLMRRIMCNEEGDPANPNVVGVPTTYQEHLRYGALNSYKWWAEGLKAEFGSEYEVVVYNYNWLTDTRYAARDFAEFVRQNNYTDMMLIGHSMGGIVANEYLAMGAENRGRVDKFIAVAVPFYGSYMASSTLENPYVFMDLIDSVFDGTFPMPEDVQSLMSTFNLSKFHSKIADLYDEMIIPFLFNMKSVYQLLPSAELLDLQASAAQEGVLEGGAKVAGKDLWSWYQSRPLARENYLGTKAEAASSALRKIFADWQEYRDGMYVAKPQGRVFACDLVDTYYVVGNNVSTEVSMSVNGEVRKSGASYAGDGTVPLLSATRGLSVEDSHVFAVDGETHIPMGTYWAGGQRAAVLSIIKGE